MTRLAPKKPSILIAICLLPLLSVATLTYAKAMNHTKILVVGDSLSAAYRLPVEAGWVAMVEQHFQKSPAGIDTASPGAKSFSNDPATNVPVTELPLSNVTITNVSISGATTAAGLKVLPAALRDHKPDIVILGLGANDGLQGKPLPYIKKNLSRLISMSKDAGAEVLLLGIRIPPNYGSAYAEPFFEQYQILSEEFETSLVPFMLEGVAVSPELMMDDGKHPNAEGQKAVFQVILPHIEELVQSINRI